MSIVLPELRLPEKPHHRSLAVNGAHHSRSVSHVNTTAQHGLVDLLTLPPSYATPRCFHTPMVWPTSKRKGSQYSHNASTTLVTHGQLLSVSNWCSHFGDRSFNTSESWGLVGIPWREENNHISQEVKTQYVALSSLRNTCVLKQSHSHWEQTVDDCALWCHCLTCGDLSVSIL